MTSVINKIKELQEVGNSAIKDMIANYASAPNTLKDIGELINAYIATPFTLSQTIVLGDNINSSERAIEVHALHDELITRIIGYYTLIDYQTRMDFEESTFHISKANENGTYETNTYNKEAIRIIKLISSVTLVVEILKLVKEAENV